MRGQTNCVGHVLTVQPIDVTQSNRQFDDRACNCNYNIPALPPGASCPKYKCDGGVCSRDDANGTYFSLQDCQSACVEEECTNYWEQGECISNDGEWVGWPSCGCVSPIVIDVLGNGFNLTNAAGGVSFNVIGDSAREQVSWTSANSDDAWLVLDRNGNGTIDDGKELFGSATSQPEGSIDRIKNGFRALAVFDSVQEGGNRDGQINNKDAVFTRLKLWQDINHNGISEPSEMHTLPELGLASISLDYKQSKQHDANGNWFGFRAKVSDTSGANLGRWAWDVFLKVNRP
jgi:hypothetical protein